MTMEATTSSGVADPEQARKDREAEFAEMMVERDRLQVELEAQCNRRLLKQREYNRRKWDPTYRASK